MFDCDAFGLLVMLTFSMPDLMTAPCKGIPLICVSEEEQLPMTDSCQPPTGTMLVSYLDELLIAQFFKHEIRINKCFIY